MNEEPITHPIPLEGEEGYPWACVKCGRIFTPKRLTRLKGSPMAKCCGTCAWENLMKFAMEEPE